MAVNIVGSTSRLSGINGVVTLFAGTGSIPNIGSYASIVGTLDATGAPSATNGSVTQIPRGGLPNQAFTLETASSTGLTNTNIMLNGWDLQGASPVSTATYFAIVIGFEPWTNGDYINICSVGLCAGDIATIPAPQTFQQVLTDCEQFYEKSYDNGTNAGTITNVGSRFAAMGVILNTNSYFSANAFDLQFRTAKRAATNVQFVSPSAGTAGNVDIRVFQAGGLNYGPTPVAIASYWTGIYNGYKSCAYIPTLNPTGDIGIGTLGSAYIQYHYDIDARLGIV